MAPEPLIACFAVAALKIEEPFFIIVLAKESGTLYLPLAFARPTPRFSTPFSPDSFPTAAIGTPGR